MEKDNYKKSPHILNASSNLAGFSFIVLTTIKALNLAGATIIDEIAALEILFFVSSSIFSFLSIRANSEMKSYFYEDVADKIFFVGLLLLFVASTFIFFSVIA